MKPFLVPLWLSLWLGVPPPVEVEGQGVELTRASPSAIKVDASDGLIFGLRWRQPLVRMGMYRTVISSSGRPAISTRHDLVIVGQGEGFIHALRLADGKKLWSHNHGAPFETAVTLLPARAEQPEIALATARNGNVLALSAENGELLWAGEVAADVRAPIQQVEDKLLVTTVANKVHVLSANDGSTLWSEGRPVPSSLTVEGHASAVPYGEMTFTAFSDGYVEAYRIADGARAWSRPLSFSGGEFIDADADPVIADGRLYVASYSDGVFALDLRDGQTVWHQPAPSVTSLAAYDDEVRRLLVAGSADGFLWALERDTGELAYRTRMPPGAASRLILRDRLVVMTAGDVGLLVFDGRTGRPLQATAMAGSLNSDPGWAGDYLAAMSDDGYLYCFSLGDPGMVR